MKPTIPTVLWGSVWAVSDGSQITLQGASAYTWFRAYLTMLLALIKFTRCWRTLCPDHVHEMLTDPVLHFVFCWWKQAHTLDSIMMAICLCSCGYSVGEIEIYIYCRKVLCISPMSRRKHCTSFKIQVWRAGPCGLGASSAIISLYRQTAPDLRDSIERFIHWDTF